MTLLINNPGELELETVKALSGQHYPGVFKVLVIDSSHDPGAPQNLIIKGASDLWEAVAPKDFAHGATRNRALDLCSSKIIVFLSQDACPATEFWLEALVAPLAMGLAEASYGRQRPRRANSERAATYEFLYPDSAIIKTKANMKELGLKTFHFSNVSSAFVCDALRSVRFPEDIPTFEDIGAAKRLLDAGSRIAYVPEAEVFHSHEMGLWAMFARYRQIGQIYEKLAIFDELKNETGSSLKEGVKVARAVSPLKGGIADQVRRAVVLGVKAGAVALGRGEAKASKMFSGRGARWRKLV